MNEPHDVPDIERWAQSVQAAVTAIRKAGYVIALSPIKGTNIYANIQGDFTNHPSPRKQLDLSCHLRFQRLSRRFKQGDQPRW